MKYLRWGCADSEALDDNALNDDLWGDENRIIECVGRLGVRTLLAVHSAAAYRWVRTHSQLPSLGSSARRMPFDSRRIRV